MGLVGLGHVGSPEHWRASRQCHPPPEASGRLRPPRRSAISGDCRSAGSRSYGRRDARSWAVLRPSMTRLCPRRSPLFGNPIDRAGCLQFRAGPPCQGRLRARAQNEPNADRATWRNEPILGRQSRAECQSRSGFAPIPAGWTFRAPGRCRPRVAGSQRARTARRETKPKDIGVAGVVPTPVFLGEPGRPDRGRDHPSHPGAKRSQDRRGVSTGRTQFGGKRTHTSPICTEDSVNEPFSSPRRTVLVFAPSREARTPSRLLGVHQTQSSVRSVRSEPISGASETPQASTQ
jgi:hypothetical protein